MKSTHYYVLPNPRYYSNGNDALLSPGSSEAGSTRGFESGNPSFALRIEDSGSASGPGHWTADPTSAARHAEPPAALDPLDSLTCGKLRVIEASIRQVTTEIEDREKLQRRLLESIDHEVCTQKELLLQVAPHGSAAFTVGDPRRRASIEKEIAALEAEKRREQTSAWKDIAQLKKELRGLLREHDEERKREEVMTQ